MSLFFKSIKTKEDFRDTVSGFACLYKYISYYYTKKAFHLCSINSLVQLLLRLLY
jgi:hypothetical protein